MGRNKKRKLPPPATNVVVTTNGESNRKSASQQLQQQLQQQANGNSNRKSAAQQLQQQLQQQANGNSNRKSAAQQLQQQHHQQRGGKPILRGKPCPPGWNSYGKQQNDSRHSNNNHNTAIEPQTLKISPKNNAKNTKAVQPQTPKIAPKKKKKKTKKNIKASPTQTPKNPPKKKAKKAKKKTTVVQPQTAQSNVVTKRDTDKTNKPAKNAKISSESNDLETRKDRDSSNSNGETIESILFLEEQVKIHEATLRAWRARRDAIVADKEAALAKKRDLVDLRANIIDRQSGLEAAQSQHLVLQAELIESLAMSREKLKRLTMLEDGDVDEEDNNNNNEGGGVKEIQIDMDGKQESPGTVQASSNANTLQEKSGEEGTNDNNGDKMKERLFDLPMVYDLYRSPNELARYQKSRFGHQCHRSLYGDLPDLDATQVGDYLTLMLRETYALDQDDGDGNSKNKERSHRRQLLQNTCLDVLLLVPPDMKNGGRHFGPGAYSDATPHLFDPSISLCPYELGGICADDLCPYQHTTKATKVLARERLLLPSLSSSFLSVEAVADPTPKAKTEIRISGKSNETKTAVQKSDSNPDIEHQHENHDQGLPPPALETLSLANHGDKAGEEEDFIMLLPDNDENDSPDGKEDDNNDESSGTDDGVDESEEEDLIMLPPSGSPIYDENNAGNHNENENVASGDCSSPENSDDEFKEGLLPLCRTPSTRPKKDPEYEFSNASSFWWGGKFPTFQDDTEGEMMPKDAKTSTVPILGILNDTFGLVTHECTKTMERKLEIKNVIVPNGNDSGDNELINELNVLGRLLDASRFALHGGLHDMAITLSQELLGRGLLNDVTLKGFAHMLRVQTEVSLFFDGKAISLSCFEVSFATQVGMSILAWSVAAYAYGKAERKQKVTNHRLADFLEAGCKSCWDLLRNPTRSVDENNVFEPLDTNQLEKRLRNDCFSETSIENTEGKDGVVRKGSHYDGIENVIIYTATRKVDDLRYLILWAQRHLIPHCDQLDASEQLLEERLNSIWLVAKKILKEHRQEQNQNESVGTKPIIAHPSDWEFQCLKVVILMGYTISGCLSNFAHAVAVLEPTLTDGDGDIDIDVEGMRGSKLSDSNLAVWTLLDRAIARVLKEMRKLLVGFPLLDVVLAPLWACSVASASYLRNYSTAQNRLVECLSGNYRRPVGTSDNPSTNVMAYSELLWSQLVQLRMSLPNESPAMNIPSVLVSDFIPNGNKLLAKRDATDDFPWEPSKTLKDENRQFVAKLSSLGIRLRHVVLWGDWMFSCLTTENRNILFRLLAKNTSEKNSSISVSWRVDLKTLRSKSPEDNSTTITNLAGQPFGSRRYPSLEPLSQLPLFLLHAGKFFTNLTLEGCSLDKLPLAFGLCFPNLQKLDLSNNCLRELPESFRRLTTRMKFLEEFRINQNQLETLPSDMLSTAATTASAASSKPSLSVSSHTPPLRVLDISYNQLVSVPSLVGLDNLEVLELHHNALVTMTVADWSRLALRLPSLRMLTREHQASSDPLSQEE